MKDWFTDKDGTIVLRPGSPGAKRFLYVLLGIVILIVIVSGRPWFTVGTEEQGLVLRFGRYVRSAGPGIHFRWPWPIESVELERVTEIKRLELGYRSTQMDLRTETKGVPNEQVMLTGDQNVVLIGMAVQYRVSDAFRYRFDVRNPDSTLKNLAEAATRQVVGDYEIDAPLTRDKAAIETEIFQKLQELADLYGLGVSIVTVQLQDVSPPEQVAGAFREVENARQSFERYINEAEGYKNSELAKVQGTVAKTINEAEAKKEQRIIEAKGEVEKFDRILREYQAAKEVTRTRLYLETIEEILPGKEKIILGADQDIFKLLNLQELRGAGTRNPVAEPPLQPANQTTGTEQR
ncbi:MAG TPA: FtsH protease activity modulator HflK [bacterium]|nr:FtsH protease activity modulator HflK [bacterium]HPO09970.1 FtsH protease activity modulator HflK [bacterium]